MSLGRVRLVLVCVGVLSCGDGAPAAIVGQVSPDRAYSDRPLRLTITGQGFLPSFQIDPAAGKRRGDVENYRGRVGADTPEPVALRDFDWIDRNTLTATMDRGLPAGQYTVEVTDPRGQAATSKLGAFWSLGPDDDAPTVVFEKPAQGTPVVGGTMLDVAIRAFDADPGTLESLRWESVAGGSILESKLCRFEATHASARCDFQVVVPVWLLPGDEFVLKATAIDTAAVPNQAEASMMFTIQRPPAVVGISPTLGGIAGGTDLVLRGTGFAPGTKVYVGGLLLLPDGGTVMDSQTIFGRTPPHVEGPATVLVRTPIGEVTLTDIFVYAQPPQIESIIPEIGDPDGATMFRVRGQRFTKSTLIFFGDTLASSEPAEVQKWDNDTQIEGFTPAGRGRTSVWAYDPDLGFSRLADGFGWGTP